jgi:hypothetical protein
LLLAKTINQRLHRILSSLALEIEEIMKRKRKRKAGWD